MEKEIVATNIKEGCINCLNYFAIFDYPLTANEIHQFNTCLATQKDIDDTLALLLNKNIIYKIEEFYLTKNKPEWIKKREKGNKLALQLLSKSSKYIKTIARFPFVRGIAISGSLSKYYASEDADIDYFIITSSNRLWIARTLLHMFKKLTFITGHQHYFCMNYFVDTNALKITHSNLYTAIETVTLLPVYNATIVAKFMNENGWVKDYLPNFNTRTNDKYLIREAKHPVKKMAEGILNVLAPQKQNQFFMKLTDRKWRRKWRDHGYSKEEYNSAFQTDISVSKNHPVNYEKKVLSKLSETSSY